MSVFPAYVGVGAALVVAGAGTPPTGVGDGRLRCILAVAVAVFAVVPLAFGQSPACSRWTPRLWGCSLPSQHRARSGSDLSTWVYLPIKYRMPHSSQTRPPLFPEYSHPGSRFGRSRSRRTRRENHAWRIGRMKSYRTEQLRNVALVGHGGAGKSSLAEALQFAHRASTRARKCSRKAIRFRTLRRTNNAAASRSNLSVVPCEWRDHKINVLDLPGLRRFFVGEVRQSAPGRRLGGSDDLMRLVVLKAELS